MSILWSRVSILVPLIALVGCDHATKYLAKNGLESQPPHQVIRSVLDLRYVENTDVAFNMLRQVPAGVRGPLLVVFGALAVALLVAILFRRTRAPGMRAGLVLILAGAIGNYSDRLFRGYVVDFIHVPHWPVFNVADICVTAGAALVGLTILRVRRAEHRPAA